MGYLRQMLERVKPRGERLAAGPSSIEVWASDSPLQDIAASGGLDDTDFHRCRVCGWIVLVDKYGFMECEDGSYICSTCLGRDRTRFRPSVRLRDL